MAVHRLPKKRRKKVHGDAATKGAVFCQGVVDSEVHFELIVPDSVFHATIAKPTFCTLSTKSGDTRRAVLLFD